MDTDLCAENGPARQALPALWASWMQASSLRPHSPRVAARAERSGRKAGPGESARVTTPSQHPTRGSTENALP
jgi:hypothetical protein